MIKLISVLMKMAPMMAVAGFGDRMVAAYKGSLNKGSPKESQTIILCSTTQYFFFN